MESRFSRAEFQVDRTNLIACVIMPVPKIIVIYGIHSYHKEFRKSSEKEESNRKVEGLGVDMEDKSKDDLLCVEGYNGSL